MIRDRTTVTRTVVVSGEENRQMVRTSGLKNMSTLLRIISLKIDWVEGSPVTSE